MEFILGILTGIAIAIGLGIWLNERDKKRKQAPRSAEFSAWLAEQTAKMMEAENYKEAARLRDLINKK